jgi:hypothetical protein
MSALFLLCRPVIFGVVETTRIGGAKANTPSKRLRVSKYRLNHNLKPKNKKGVGRN